ncbi:phospholipase D-like domain-containing protein [Cryobacterium sp. MDB2-10]|uniref:phospholipase D-like domain-containing protein n=1 Tax=Cryobacterium sp. MDB2-10 TaxID=1259177 RepID=UPI0014309718|nr:phospholipase D-like domain-containing protein [Cryobacterium sp. MDB2-10]
MNDFAGPGSSDLVTRSLHKEQPVLDSADSFEWDNDQRSTISGTTVAHFGDLTERLVEFIENSEAVVGCVAWLTEPRVLTALARPEVSIVVQKEDFLRPDSSPGDRWKHNLRTAYGKLHNEFTRHLFPNPLSFSSFASSPELDPIRCVGIHNSQKASAIPRMHHKFLVRLKLHESNELSQYIQAVGVWTGSFNFSKNGGYSFENAVEIYDPSIAEAYLQEFARVMALSEPLDWESDWVYPEWRIGT